MTNKGTNEQFNDSQWICRECGLRISGISPGYPCGNCGTSHYPSQTVSDAVAVVYIGSTLGFLHAELKDITKENETHREKGSMAINAIMHTLKEITGKINEKQLGDDLVEMIRSLL